MIWNSKGIIQELTKERVLELVPEKELWEKYINEEVIIGKKICSPLEAENDPSSVFFISRNNTILLHDFRFGTYNIWSYLKKKYNWSVLDSLSHIKADFGLQDYNTVKVPVMKSNEVINPVIKEGISKKIYVKRDKWKDFELEYWKSYGITEGTLDTLQVYPISQYWVQGKDEELLLFKRLENELMFCFDFGKEVYKIYKPNNKEFKWFFNGSSDILMGTDSLPWIDDTLVVTKGMKETLIIREMSLNSIGIQGETSFPDSLIIKTLKYRFKNIYYLADIDEPGLRSMKYAESKFNWIPIYLPQELLKVGIKDLADVVKNEGIVKWEINIKKSLEKI